MMRMRMTARGFFFRYRIWVLTPSDYCIVKLSRTRVSNKRPGVQNGPGKEFSWTSFGGHAFWTLNCFLIRLRAFHIYEDPPHSLSYSVPSVFSQSFLSFTHNVGVYSCVPTNYLALCCLVCEHIV